MSAKGLTTGQAAVKCGVTPDTVLKWIRTGRLPARRTPGGHHRIDEADLEALMRPVGAESDAEEVDGDAVADAPMPPARGRHFHYCWEFHGRGKLLNGCRRCAVFKMRAHRCYEVAALQAEVGHNGVFCQSTCAECDYYRKVHGQETNVLVVTDDPRLRERLEGEATASPFNLRLADCEYNCSAIVDSFRPDFAIVDCALGKQRSRDICNHLIEDPRVPFVRVILAARPEELPKTCNKEVFAQLDKPFGVDDINECISAACADDSEVEEAARGLPSPRP